MKYIAELTILIILLFFAALTAASEISIIAISRVRLRKLAAEGSRTAKIVLTILETPERFFGTILVANNIVDALIASLVTAVIIRFMGEGNRVIFIATAIVSLLIIVSEVAAKTFAVRHSERLSLFLARPVKVLISIFSPVVKILEVITNFIVNLIGGKAKGKASLVTEEEIRALIKVGEEEGVIQKEKYKLLSRAFDFSEVIVRSAMTLKDAMVLIDISANLDDIFDRVLESGYSRLPVYRDKPDNIIGIINMKDLLNLAVNKDLIVLQDILYPPVFVPGSKKVTELLKDFQKGHTHLALVVDPQGKIEGLVTLEDLLEEIVGEIQDEYDVREASQKKNKP